MNVWRHVDVNLQDGFEHPSLRRMRGSISADSAENKVHDHLMKLLGKTCKFEELISPVVGGSVTSIVKPSTLFGLLHARDREKFERVFGAEKQSLKQCWSDLFATEAGQELR